jgi:hypothetical protein
MKSLLKRQNAGDEALRTLLTITTAEGTGIAITIGDTLPIQVTIDDIKREKGIRDRRPKLNRSKIQWLV